MNDAAPLPNADAVDVAKFYLSGLPDFAAYFALALVFAALFATLYSTVTPHHEFRLIRSGNRAAIPALLGAMLGFVLPVRAAMGGAVALGDFALWAVIAALVQVAAYFLARQVMPDVSERITRDEPWAGVWLGGVAVVVGALNAAAMTN